MLRVSRSVPLALFALSLLSGGALAGTDGSPSLEELLRRAREQQRKERAALAPRVEQLVGELEATFVEEDDVVGIHDQLVALGPEAAPLLVKHIDPGSAGGHRAELRATEVTRALAALGSPSITAELVRLTSEGSRIGRLHAIELLGYSADRDVASARLTALFNGTSGDPRRAAAAALARLGGEQNASFLHKALTDTDVEVVTAVLRALIAAPSESGNEAVLAMLRRPSDAARSLDLVLEYLRRAPTDVQLRSTQDLLVLAADKRLGMEQRVAIVDEVPALGPELDAALRRRLDALLESTDTELRDAARICLALLGDRQARRTLIRTYDDHVDQNSRWPTAYRDRGGILMRLHEYDDAAKDFKQAIEVADARGKPAEFEVWIDLARAYALAGKQKQAYEALRDAPIPGSVLARLGADPDFRELREHSRYGRVFDG